MCNESGDGCNPSGGKWLHCTLIMLLFIMLLFYWESLLKKCAKWQLYDQFYLSPLKKKITHLLKRVGEGAEGFKHVTVHMDSVWLDLNSLCHCSLMLLYQVFMHECPRRTGCDQFKMALSGCMKNSLWDMYGNACFMIYSDRVFTLLL